MWGVTDEQNCSRLSQIHFKDYFNIYGSTNLPGLKNPIVVVVSTESVPFLHGLDYKLSVDTHFNY
jgi:hypothetical protein